MFRKNTLLFLLVVFLLGAGAYWYLSKTYPQTSPFLTGWYYIESIMNPHAKLNKHVMGFLPYWQVDGTQHIKPHLLSEINYFSLDVNADGEIKTVINGETDPGWNGWQKDAVRNIQARTNIAGTDFTVTIAALNNEVIEGILQSKTAQRTFIKEVTQLVKDYNLDGVNIDFEYLGNANAEEVDAFTNLSIELAVSLKKEVPYAKLSLSVLPMSARSNDILDFPRLAPVYDRFIGMSYDFYGQNADIAGPVAPMKGFKDNKYFFDVETMYEDLVKVIPKEKIVMGIPYYGWDRAVTDGKVINSTTLSGEDSYAAVISYARAREDNKIKSKQCSWDSYAMETWCWYTENKIDHQVWLMDNRSIQTRFDYAKSQNFGGVGIWVLGYDKNYADLWDMIRKKFSK